MTHGEFLQPSGRIEMRNLDIYYKPLPGYDFQTDTYILKGEGRETWTPDFTYHGFRYVELRSSAPVKLDQDESHGAFHAHRRAFGREILLLERAVQPHLGDDAPDLSQQPHLDTHGLSPA